MDGGAIVLGWKMFKPQNRKLGFDVWTRRPLSWKLFSIWRQIWDVLNVTSLRIMFKQKRHKKIPGIVLPVRRLRYFISGNFSTAWVAQFFAFSETKNFFSWKTFCNFQRFFSFKTNLQSPLCQRASKFLLKTFQVKWRHRFFYYISIWQILCDVIGGWIFKLDDIIVFLKTYFHVPRTLWRQWIF